MKKIINENFKPVKISINEEYTEKQLKQDYLDIANERKLKMKEFKKHWQHILTMYQSNKIHVKQDIAVHLNRMSEGLNEMGDYREEWYEDEIVGTMDVMGLSEIEIDKVMNDPDVYDYMMSLFNDAVDPEMATLKTLEFAVDRGLIVNEQPVTEGVLNETTLADMYREMGTWFTITPEMIRKAEATGITSDNNPQLAELVDDWGSGMYDEDPDQIFNEIEYLINSGGDISEYDDNEGEEHPAGEWQRQKADRRWNKDHKEYDPDEEEYYDMDEDYNPDIMQSAMDDSKRRAQEKEKRWGLYDNPADQGMAAARADNAKVLNRETIMDLLGSHTVDWYSYDDVQDVIPPETIDYIQAKKIRMDDGLSVVFSEDREDNYPALLKAIQREGIPFHIAPDEGGETGEGQILIFNINDLD